MRLAHFLASTGLAARRKCEELIEQGKITINGEEAQSLSIEVDENQDEIRLDGKRLVLAAKRYVMLYKPVGYTCSSDDQYAEKLAIDLLPQSLGRLFTVGRLDRDSEGLLLCTNDGQWANLLAHPRYGVTKLYRVSVAGNYSRAVLDQMRKGVVNEGEFLRPLKVFEVRAGRNFAQLEILLNEGKKREIRRLCYSCGLEVKRLLRLRIGDLKLLKLKPGEWRELKPEEIEGLRELALSSAKINTAPTRLTRKPQRSEFSKNIPKTSFYQRSTAKPKTRGAFSSRQRKTP